MNVKEKWNFGDLDEIMGGDGIAKFLDGTESHDADYSYIPSLSDKLVLLIMARLPPSLYQTLRLINKHYHAL
ncbi:hypothetical protein MRB53_028352 [Persea americana]|uniref:Uncharacterized protein n=1 Tax=Persea americana TaxID=3435 RepID=A0ACC2KFH3_PERAE|nr:hypothetical protein MRB53_028352 [Persea americana]